MADNPTSPDELQRQIDESLRQLRAVFQQNPLGVQPTGAAQQLFDPQDGLNDPMDLQDLGDVMNEIEKIANDPLSTAHIIDNDQLMQGLMDARSPAQEVQGSDELEIAREELEYLYDQDIDMPEEKPSATIEIEPTNTRKRNRTVSPVPGARGAKKRRRNSPEIQPAAQEAVTSSTGAGPSSAGAGPSSGGPAPQLDISGATQRMWCELELDIIRLAKLKHPIFKQAYPEIRQQLTHFGFNRTRDMVRNRFRHPDVMKVRGFTKEESFDIRDLQSDLEDKGMVARSQFICRIFNTTREVIKGHLYRKVILQRRESGPVPWTREEDELLLKGINDNYDGLLAAKTGGKGTLWDKVKMPLYGRSINACKRRYDMMHLHLWTVDDVLRVIEHVEGQSATNTTIDYSEIADSLPGRNELACAFRFAMHKNILYLNAEGLRW